MPRAAIAATPTHRKGMPHDRVERVVVTRGGAGATRRRGAGRVRGSVRSGPAGAAGAGGARGTIKRGAMRSVWTSGSCERSAGGSRTARARATSSEGRCGMVARGIEGAEVGVGVEVGVEVAVAVAGEGPSPGGGTGAIVGPSSTPPRDRAA